LSSHLLVPFQRRSAIAALTRSLASSIAAALGSIFSRRLRSRTVRVFWRIFSAIASNAAFVTPAVIEDVVLSRPHEVTLSGPGVKDLTLAVPIAPGQLVARVHGRVESSMGSIAVESEPTGASVLFDGKPAGTTPATIRDLRLDIRHRIDLALPGYEVDQFVVLPGRDGERYVRHLTREGKAKKTGTP
jgi:hypothetical protein